MKNYVTVVIILIMISTLLGCTQPVEKDDLKVPAAMKSVDTKEDPTQKVIPLSEVRMHDTRDSCYTVIDDRVYDLTDFIDNSPEYRTEVQDEDMTVNEFRERLTMMCGMDGTILFVELFGENHMRIDQYFIGNLEA